MIRRSLSVAACLLLAFVTSHAQSNYAVVRGSILDPQHRPVPGALVHMTATTTGAQREVVDDDHDGGDATDPVQPVLALATGRHGRGRATDRLGDRRQRLGHPPIVRGATHAMSGDPGFTHSRFGN